MKKLLFVLLLPLTVAAQQPVALIGKSFDDAASFSEQLKQMLAGAYQYDTITISYEGHKHWKHTTMNFHSIENPLEKIDVYFDQFSENPEKGYTIKQITINAPFDAISMMYTSWVDKDADMVKLKHTGGITKKGRSSFNIETFANGYNNKYDVYQLAFK